MLGPCWCCCKALFLGREQHERELANRGEKTKKKTQDATGNHDSFVYTLSEYSTSEDDEEHDDSYFIPKESLVVELSAGGGSSSKLSDRMSIHISS